MTGTRGILHLREKRSPIAGYSPAQDYLGRGDRNEHSHQCEYRS